MSNHEQEELWKSLGSRYREKGLALALGAGLSHDSGLPGWSTLLEGIARRCRGDEAGLLVRELQKLFTLPVVAGMVENLCSGQSFAGLIRDALYEHFPLYRHRDDASAKVRLKELVQTSNHTLAAVAALCAVDDSRRGGFNRNTKIKAIVNTNFDALLTSYVDACYGRSLIRTIDRPSASSSTRRINTYHVHGFMQFWEDKIGNPTKEAPDIRVLTEHEFFDFFNQPTQVYSYSMLYVLREYVVLFVGMSLQDDNMRRLLHYSYQERYESYQRERKPEDRNEDTIAEDRRKAVRHYALQEKRGQLVDEMVEQSLHRLGVRALWYDTHAEIPALLGHLYSQGGDRWSDVYDERTV